MVPLDLFRHGRLSGVVIATVCAYLALGGMLYLLPLLFQNVKGYEPFDAGLSLLPISAAFMITAPFSGRVVRRFGASDVIAAGCGLSAVGVAGVALTGVGTAYIVFVPLYLLVGFGFGLIMPTVAVAAIAAVDRSRSGLASGISTLPAKSVRRWEWPHSAHSAQRLPPTAGSRTPSRSAPVWPHRRPRSIKPWRAAGGLWCSGRSEATGAPPPPRPSFRACESRFCARLPR